MDATESRSFLIAGGDPAMRACCETVLEPLGFSVISAQDETEVLSYLGSAIDSVDAVLLDVAQYKPDGSDLLRVIREFNPALPVIVASALATIDNIVNVMRMGAADFLPKPLDCDRLGRAVRRLIESEPASHRSGARAPQKNAEVFLGNSPIMRKVQALIGTAGWSDAPILIHGETGTGKEVIARQLHARSRRSAKPFLKINCAALPSDLIESELFGYERGAFTGAIHKKSGLFEEANGGTLLLDEIGDMDFRLQSRLLHVLQDSSFLRVGGREAVKVDVRVMAATHCDLETAIANRTFREDLFYRLNVINIQLPPLRDRKDDLLVLTEFLVARHAVPGIPAPVVTKELTDALMAYNWPGNIRELENCVRKLLIFGDPETIARELRAKTDIADRAAGSVPFPGIVPKPFVLKNTVSDEQRSEADTILSALNSTCWNRRRAAGLLKIQYNSLRLKMKKLGIVSAVSIASRAGGNGA